MVSKTAKRWLITLAVVVATVEIVALLLIYVGKQFVGETVEVGSAHGFNIGAFKDACYDTAAGVFAGADVFIHHVPENERVGARRDIHFTPDERALLSGRDTLILGNNPQDTTTVNDRINQTIEYLRRKWGH